MDKLTILNRKLRDIRFDSDKWALYGTGDGAELIYNILRQMGAIKYIKYVIEQDKSNLIGKKFHHIPIVNLSDASTHIDGIIVAAAVNHRIVTERIMKTLSSVQLQKIKVINIFTYNTKADKQEYVEYIENSALRESKEFVKFNEIGYQKNDIDTKVIAWYLPQFHQIEINDKFHGQGFTEWTNTSRTIPVFTGHYQPHIPYDVGYYDLLNPDTFKRQIYLAKHYGIFGFCIHYYWFSGKKLMEKPLELLLKHKELDMPFCLDWATENWTALWDGGNNEVMLEQKLNPKDATKFMEDIMPYMKDSRYIKIDGKPVLIIYRVNIFEQSNVRELLCNFRKIAKTEGFPNLYIMITNAFGFEDDVTEWGADALVEYQPHLVFRLMEEYQPLGYVNPYFNGKIVDTSSFMENKRYMINHNNKIYFRSALTSFDNTARKFTSHGWILNGLNPETFKQWLLDIVIESSEIHSEEENIVFVNSWNEWAEGSHLEPDMKYGYGYLQSVYEAIRESYKYR